MSGSAGMTKIEIDAASIADGDSIAAYLVDSAGTLLTSTLVGADQSLDVNVTQSALPAGAATEATLASILAEIESYTYADGSAWGAGSIGIESLAVRQDATGPLTGVADGDFTPLQVDSNGHLKTTAVVDFAGDYAEDSGHVSGDVGLFQLGVRNDDQATTVTSGNADYSQHSVDDRGAMFVKDTAARSNLQQIVTVGTTALPLPASPLAKRSSMFVQMLSGGSLFLGSATVTNVGATRGFKMGNGDFVNVDVGPANLVYGIADAAGKEVMVWEFA